MNLYIDYLESIKVNLQLSVRLVERTQTVSKQTKKIPKR